MQASSTKHQKSKHIVVNGKFINQADLIEQAWLNFSKMIRATGNRITLSRKIIFEMTLSRNDHFTADQIASQLNHGNNRVSRGTVYRTINLMVEYGLLRAIKDDDVHTHFEPNLNPTPHEHLICNHCGSFIEFTDPVINEQVEKICDEYNFNARQQSLVILGLCQQCQGENE